MGIVRASDDSCNNAAERARGQCRRGGVSGVPVSCGVMGWVPPWWRPRAGGVRPHSLWWARQGSGICEGDGTARAHAWPSEWFWPGPMRHPAGWPDVDGTRPSDRARWRASWRGSRRAGRGRRPCGRWLGVRRRSARSRRARIGTGAGPGTVSRRGFWPLGAPRGALVRHPVTGVPGRVSRVAPGHGARAVAPIGPSTPCAVTRRLVTSSPGHRTNRRAAIPLPWPGCLSRMARMDTRAPISRAPVAGERARHEPSSASSSAW